MSRITFKVNFLYNSEWCFSVKSTTKVFSKSMFKLSIESLPSVRSIPCYGDGITFGFLLFFLF